MRHGSSPACPVALLAEGVPAGSLGRRLVAPTGGPDRFSPPDGAAGSRAIALAPVTAGTDPDLHPALPALEDTVAFLDCRAGRGP
jgi:hypothetical protein